MNQLSMILLILYIIMVFASGLGDYEVYHANDIKSLLEKSKELDLNNVMILGDLDVRTLKRS